MNAKPLAVITTRLPPAVCGIGTYSWLLAQHWPESARPSEFLVLEHSAPNESKVTAFGGDPAALARALARLGAADVWLHYAGRAYHPLGFPFWLPRMLAKWKQRFPGARLLLFVHELPGAFPWTSRHYWLSRLADRVTKRLLAMADVVVTNTEHHRARLHTLAGIDALLVPVSSNIEPVAAPAERIAGDFVLFGLPFGRRQTLELFAPFLRRWHAAGRLRRLHLIGPEGDDALAGLPKETLIRHGVLPPEEVSRLLRHAAFCLTNATAETWQKSTTFMAAAAHACPVIASVPLRHTVQAAEVATIAPAEAQARAEALRAWYEANASWAVVAQKLAAL